MLIKRLYSNNQKQLAEIKYLDKVTNKYSFHFHNELYLSMVEGGSVIINYTKDEKYIKKDGELFVFNPEQIHMLENIDAKGYYIFCIDQKYYKDIVNNKVLIHNIDFSKEINEEFLNICKNLLYKDINIKDKLEAFLNKLYKNYSKNEDKKENSLIKEVDKYILSNINDKLSTDDISKHLAYDKSYFIRNFKRNTGLTPNNYIMNYKIEKAKTLLDNPKNTKIVSLAHEFGFYDQSHFDRNFKKLYAASPNKYLI